MKTKLLWILAIVAVLAGMTACKQKATYLKSDVEKIEILSDGGTDTIVLHSDAPDFELVSSPDWVDTQLVDSLLIVKVGKNTTSGVRNGKIAIVNGEQKLNLPVVQVHEATFLNVFRESVTIPKDGGSDTLRVATDGSRVHVLGAEGIQTEYKDGVLTFKGKGNKDAMGKQKITIVVDSIKKEITVM